jgi:hypothetical protein
MSLIDFKLGFLDQLLTFLWRQWSALGVLGESGAEDDWVLDPEALLIFSLQMARYEPRLFDEILSWLLVNGGALDASRLKSIVKNYDARDVRVVGATLQFLIRHADKRKWTKLAGYCSQIWKSLPQSDSLESLFKRKQDGVPYPLIETRGKEDLDFLMFYLDRATVSTVKTSQDVPVNARTNLRFMTRSLFGIGSRAECVVYLLTNEGGQPRDIADATGLFWLGVQQTLGDLSKSGLVLKRSGEGKRKKKIEYWVSHKRWWEFIAFASPDWTPPKWLNWVSIYSALWTLWQNIDTLSRSQESDYLKSSKLHDSLEVLQSEFTRAGYDLPPLPSMAVSSDLYQHAALKFLGELFKVPAPAPNP